MKKMPLLIVMVFLISSCSQPTLTPLPATTIPPSNTPPVPSTQTPHPPTATPSPHISIDGDIVYAEVNGIPSKLDVYIPEGSGPWPTVILVHGMGQTKSDYSAMAEEIADNKTVVYNINVNHSPPYDASIHRIACAVRFARATAQKYHADPEWMILVGDSGGALTGMITALAGDDFGDQCTFSDGSALVDAFVGYEGVYEFIITEPPDSMKYLDFTYLEKEDPELWRTLNPYTHIGRNPSLKVRLVHGDFIESSMMSEVPVEWSINLHQSLQEAGYDTELVVVEGADHDDIIDPGSDAYQQVVEEVFKLVNHQ